MAERRVPKRAGNSHNLTLDADISEMLRQYAPSPKTQGRYVSGLVRADVARKEERQRLRTILLAALEEEGTP
jgi:hypothetical protein